MVQGTGWDRDVHPEPRSGDGAAATPSLELKLFHARFGPEAPPPERWIRGFWMQELDASIRSLYPRWDLLARPPPPRVTPVGRCRARHEPRSIPPAAPGQKLVVTVHDLAFERFPGLFPRRWRLLYRLGLRAAVKRADAILTPSRSTADDIASRTKVDPARLHVVPLASSLATGTLDVAEVLARRRIRSPYVLFAGTLEPRKNLVRLVRADRRVASTGAASHALVLAGATASHHGALMRYIAQAGPGEVILTWLLLAEADLDALSRGQLVRVPSLYEGFPACRSSRPWRGACLDRLDNVVGTGGLGRGRPWAWTHGRCRDLGRDPADPDRHRAGRATSRGGSCTGGALLVGPDGDRDPRGLRGGAERPVKVSLVTTVLNADGHVADFLESVAAQSRPPDEIVVVDGGSTDGTLETLRSAPGITLIEEAGAGIARGRNVAIAATTHDVIAVSDADCLLEPDWLERLMVPLEAGADVAMGAYRPIARTFLERRVWRP